MENIEIGFKKNIKNGLYHGRCGAAILLALTNSHLKGWQGNSHLISLMEEISENISDVDSLGFSNGISGIGWAIEWLSQNRFIQIDSDDVLEDIDDLLYQQTMHALPKDLSLETGAVGILHYFLIRTIKTNAKADTLRSIYHQECLVYISDCIAESTLVKYGSLEILDADEENIIEFGQILFAFEALLRTRINLVAVEEIFYLACKKVYSALEQLRFDSRLSSPSISGGVLSLINCFLVCSEKQQHKIWNSSASDFLYNLTIGIPPEAQSRNTLDLSISLLTCQFSPRLANIHQRVSDEFSLKNELIELIRYVETNHLREKIREVIFLL